MSDETLSVEGNNGFGIVKEILEANKSLLTEITLLSREYQPTAAFNDQAVVPIADKIDFTQLHEYLQEENILKYPHVGYIPEIITPLVQTPFHIISWWDSKSASNHTLYGIFVPNEDSDGGDIVVVKTDAWLYGTKQTTDQRPQSEELVASTITELGLNSHWATCTLRERANQLHLENPDANDNTSWILAQLTAIQAVSKLAN